MTEPPEAARLTGRISRVETIVHNYQYFYYLANEMAYSACQAEEQYRSAPEEHTPLNEYRYSIATVILSFTFAEGYVNDLMHSPESPIGKLFDKMSSDLREQIDRLALPEKIEFIVLHYPESKGSEFDRGKEPFQSFDLLRQLRNFLIHYRPRLETTWSEEGDYEREALKLERKVSGRFAFSKHIVNDAFVYRCFSKDCARWSFKVSRNFVDWVSETLSMDKPIYRDYWPLDDDVYD